MYRHDHARPATERTNHKSKQAVKHDQPAMIRRRAGVQASTHASKQAGDPELVFCFLFFLFRPFSFLLLVSDASARGRRRLRRVAQCCNVGRLGAPWTHTSSTSTTLRHAFEIPAWRCVGRIGSFSMEILPLPPTRHHTDTKRARRQQTHCVSFRLSSFQNFAASRLHPAVLISSRWTGTLNVTSSSSESSSSASNIRSLSKHGATNGASGDRPGTAWSRCS